MSALVETCILARRCTTEGDDFCRLAIYDVLPTYKAARGNLTFRNVDEVMRAIAQLESVLPVIERLGRLAT